MKSFQWPIFIGRLAGILVWWHSIALGLSMRTGLGTWTEKVKENKTPIRSRKILCFADDCGLKVYMSSTENI